MSIFLNHRQPPPNRVKGCADEFECVLSEAAVMIAFAEYLMANGAVHIEVHPDGEHGKRHDIRATLGFLGFEHVASVGTTTYGGSYQRGIQSLTVALTPGLGDVVAEMNGSRIIAECKGGVMNTKHAGQTSKLRTGLCEVVGLLMARPLLNDRHVAVVPHVPVTSILAKKMLPRCEAAGIEIALIGKDGSVKFVA